MGHILEYISLGPTARRTAHAPQNTHSNIDTAYYGILGPCCCQAFLASSHKNWEKNDTGMLLNSTYLDHEECRNRSQIQVVKPLMNM